MRFTNLKDPRCYTNSRDWLFDKILLTNNDLRSTEILIHDIWVDVCCRLNEME